MILQLPTFLSVHFSTQIVSFPIFIEKMNHHHISKKDEKNDDSLDLLEKLKLCGPNIGPAYKATPRQGNKATICDVILISVSRYIINKRRHGRHHLQISLRQVKMNKRRHSAKNGVKFNKKRHCRFLNQ